MRLPVLRDGELERWLEAYAAVRLSPDRATASRLRARVMREWDARAATTPASIPAIAAVALGRSQARRVRRVMLPVVVAALGTSVLVGSTLAATPGAPLYGTRVWAETLMLPADPAARARAQVGRLEQRLAEALEAARNGNAAGAAAATTAYREILAVAMTEGAATDGTMLTLLAPAIERHRSVLATLLHLVPADARPEVAATIEGVERVADRLDIVGSTPPAGTGAVIPAPSRLSPSPDGADPARPIDDRAGPSVPPPVATPARSLAALPATTAPGGPLPAPTLPPDATRIAAPVATPGPTPPPEPAPSRRPSPEPKPMPAATVRPTAQPLPVATPGVPERSPAAPDPSTRVEPQPGVPEPQPSPPERERRKAAPPAPLPSESSRATGGPASSSPAPPASPPVPPREAEPTPRPSAAVATPAPSSPSPSGSAPAVPTRAAPTPAVPTPSPSGS
jgi:hypothetical protein